MTENLPDLWEGGSPPPLPMRTGPEVPTGKEG